MSTSSRLGLDDDRRVVVVFLAGLALAALMLTRSQVAGDQLNLLARGWLLAREGQWVPLGLPTSAGGVAPGGLAGVVVGLPLLVWSDHRAPTVLILAAHVLGYLLLDRIVARLLGSPGRLLFAILYWLNPWRLYYSAFLWNPNYLIPVGAVHLWTIYHLRLRARFWPSFLHVLLVGLAVQLHLSAVVLALGSALLWWRGYCRLHWRGALLAALVVLASLVPWGLAVLADPSLMPHGSALAERALRLPFAAFRALAYWVRYGSFLASQSVLCFDFSLVLGAGSRVPVRPPAALVAAVLGLLTLPLPVWANYRLWRHSGRWWRARSTVADDGWLEGVIRWSFVGAILACCLSPTTPMSWQLLPVLHMAILPAVLAVCALLQGRRSVAANAAFFAYALASVALVVAIALGSPVYRCGGERCDSKNVTMPALRSDHPMLHQLGIASTCPVAVDRPDGWWPDVLPEPARRLPSAAGRGMEETAPAGESRYKGTSDEGSSRLRR